ncbi:hypothetical protein ACFRAR_09925 [Kitasatospora sp. NPDC056651]
MFATCPYLADDGYGHTPAPRIGQGSHVSPDDDPRVGWPELGATPDH